MELPQEGRVLVKLAIFSIERLMQYILRMDHDQCDKNICFFVHKGSLLVACNGEKNIILLGNRMEIGDRSDRPTKISWNERVGGIGPPSSAWKAEVIPVYDTRIINA